MEIQALATILGSIIGAIIGAAATIIAAQIGKSSDQQRPDRETTVFLPPSSEIRNRKPQIWHIGLPIILVGSIGYAIGTWVNMPSVAPAQTASPSIPPPSNTAILTATPSPRNTATPTPIGRSYTIRFVARSIPTTELHTAYYSVDGGKEQRLFSTGSQFDTTFDATFSQSTRVWVDINPGTVIHEELYVDGTLITSSDNADYNGLIYQVKR
jgi:hypothetical protein